MAGGRLNQQLRIIGGCWRGRRLSFPPLPGLRPTPDRVRETLFNWLAPMIAGTRCLDLFAGSGALGMEALSRGAAEVVFVEHHPLIAQGLKENLHQLGSASAQVEQADVLSWLQGPVKPADIVFLDPPFSADLLTPVCTALEEKQWLNPGARIYLESERDLQILALPQDWEIIREKTAGSVSYRLIAVYS